jgi:hypothetical protein
MALNQNSLTQQEPWPPEGGLVIRWLWPADDETQWVFAACASGRVNAEILRQVSMSAVEATAASTTRLI